MSNPRTLAASVVAAVAAAFAGLAIHGAGDSSATDAPRILTLNTPFASGTTSQIDVGKRGFGPGDMALAVNASLRDDQTGRRVGQLDGMETVLSRAHNGTVHMTAAIRLREGRIEVAGTLRHTDRAQALAVIGGTGAYANARGEMTQRENEKRKVTILRITLLP
jgi:hypothetical protein